MATFRGYVSAFVGTPTQVADANDGYILVPQRTPRHRRLRRHLGMTAVTA
jgi:hypothetical protein